MRLTTYGTAAFTMLEIMITMVIALVISFLAYPVMNTYFVQAKVADALQAVAPIQSMVNNQIADLGSVTNSGASLNTPATISQNIASYAVSNNGVISITTSPAAGGISLTLTPVYDATSEQVSWACAVSDASMDPFVPNECRI